MQEFLVEVMLSLVNCGDAYLRLEPTGSITVLKPSEMSVTWTQADIANAVRRYEYNRRRVFEGVNMKVVAINRGPEDLTGFGPMQSDRIAGLLAEQEYIQSVFENGGNPSGILHVPRELTKDEADAAKAQWIAAHSGSTRTPAVLSGGIEWNSTGFNASQSQWVEGHLAGVGDAALLFGIPGALMDYNTPGASLTYSNIGDLNEQFWRATLYPTYARRIEEALTEMLGVRVYFDPEEFFLASLATRSNSARQLVDGGWDPDGVLDVVGLPPIPYRTDAAPTTLQPTGEVSSDTV
jgi:HK97 family phage portal protein